MWLGKTNYLLLVPFPLQKRKEVYGEQQMLLIVLWSYQDFLIMAELHTCVAAEHN